MVCRRSGKAVVMLAALLLSPPLQAQNIFDES
jgi:hypothetical protein